MATLNTSRALMASRTLEATDGDKDGQPVGRIKALVSAYGVKYKIGWALWHTIEAGAFADAVGSVVPFYADHDWGYGNPPFGESAVEDSDEGLVVVTDMYIEDPAVARLYKAIKAGTVKEYSIGYKPITTTLDPDDEDHETVSKAELLEASSVLRGANPNTKTLEASAPSEDAVAQLVEAIKAGVFDEELAKRVALAGVPEALEDGSPMAFDAVELASVLANI